MTMRFFSLGAIALVTLFLSSCDSYTRDYGSQARVGVVRDDKAILDAISPSAGEVVNLTLEDALDRANAVNLDIRLAALETLSNKRRVGLQQLQALPSIKTKRERVGRSNPGASSSQSIISGNQSLEPSVSSDRYRDVQELTVNWDVIDASLALLEARTASDRTRIAAERQKKIMQNVARDVYAAYARALIAQEAIRELNELENEMRRHVGNVKYAQSSQLISMDDSLSRITRFESKLDQMLQFKKELSLAGSELKSLLSIDYDAHLMLSRHDLLKDFSQYSDLGVKPTDLEDVALFNRSEIREEVLEKEINMREARNEILRTIPGANLFFALNRDSNSFLDENEWNNFSFSITQNITNLLTLPSRYSNAKSRADTTDSRRLALVAAILAQVNISQVQLEFAQEEYRNARDTFNSVKKAEDLAYHMGAEGFNSYEKRLLSRVDAFAQHVNLRLAHANLRDTYVSLVHSLGLPLSIRTLSPQSLRAIVRDEVARINSLSGDHAGL